jgi:Winged helix DNA-binding domain
MITKQSVNDLLRHLEGHGYLLRVPDSVDGRARVIRLTAKGRRIEQTIYAEAGAAQLRIAGILGPRRFALLHSPLSCWPSSCQLHSPSPDNAGSRACPRFSKCRGWLRRAGTIPLSGERAAQALRVSGLTSYRSCPVDWSMS